jgi:outer membrane protein insertion porin family
LTGSFIHDTRNRTVFADRGNLQRANLEFTIPGSDLTYYKLDYRFQHYIPIHKWLTGAFNSQVAYGDSYGDTTDLPFFEKYFAGGIRTVRGYKSNRLGPRDSNGDAFGGNFRVVGNLELLFPPPFFGEAKNMRMSTFVDAGNVYAGVDDFSVSEIRASVGMGMTWLSPVGALTFSFAKAFNDQPQDQLEFFQFSIGTSF